MSEEAKTKTVAGTGSVQRGTEGREEVKAELRRKVKAIREGHTTGGYCDTEALRRAEQPLYDLLSDELEEAKKRFGYSPDPKFKHPTIRVIELEINGLAFKPRLVVAHD